MDDIEKNTFITGVVLVIIVFLILIAISRAGNDNSYNPDIQSGQCDGRTCW